MFYYVNTNTRGEWEVVFKSNPLSPVITQRKIPITYFVQTLNW